ncbi:uncharacterized protein RHOBADRAFT_53596 [Rhodotorula graminis WP1]|uniref:Transcription factor TFIIIC complex subunit Tfc6 n=1 Tax=Rhodotorula graminis (strain WP1) TaxID=578459 RepID=A0A194S5D9_RHOGW|nr:uncharacterized protein RHOBADRAFT_53596 [Rhodotorula graminis WP1]KPV74631.1 hypothetical protein RHOBADRAFT_53596 [Rhodotorula graminis WP1]
MAARPRRSTASTSYAHLLAPLNLTSSSSSSSSDEALDSNKTRPGHDATSQAPDTKPKKKRKPVYIPDESSGSEFELPDKHPGAPGGAGTARDDDDDDDDDSAAGSALDLDDLDDGASISGASGLSGSIVGGSPPPGGARRGAGGRGRGRGRGRGARTGVSAGRSAGRASVVVAASAVAQRTGSAAGGVAPPRAKPSDRHPATALGLQHPWIGPLAALAPSVPLEGEGKRGAPRRFAAGRAGEPGVLRDEQVHELLEMHSGNPFGVDKAWARDMDYVPGRYDVGVAGEGKVREREKWGGWYDELEVKDEDIVGVSSHHVSHFLPRQVYPTDRPSTIFTPSVPLPGSKEAADAAAAAAADSPAPDPSLDLPIPPVELQTSTAPSTSRGPSTASQQDTSSELDGRIRLLCGGIVASGIEEQAVELERFETRRLDEIVSKKPGHLFNAGAPIGSLAFAPRADGPSDKEYLLVTTTSSPDALLRHPLSSSSSSSATGTASSSTSSSTTSPSALLQLWSVPSGTSLAPETADDDSARMRLELALCVNGLGECKEAAWCPRGGRAARAAAAGSKDGEGKGKGREDAMDVDDEAGEAEGAAGEDKGNVGLVAGVFGDGTVAVLAVPDPERAREKLRVEEDEVAFVKASPLLRLQLPDTSIYALAWGGHEVLAAGCLNGYIAVWRVGDILLSGKQPDRPLRPTHYFSAHTAVIRQLVFISTPPPKLDNRAEHDLDGAPTGIVSVGYDGSALLSDLREPGGATSVLTHERTALYTVAFSAHTGMAYTTDADDRVKGLGLKPSMQGNEGRVTIHRGPVWSVAASPHHATTLSASLDGTAMLASGVRALRKRRLRGHYLTRLYRLEVERTSGAVRMWDNLDVEFRGALDPYNPFSKTSSSVPLERSTAAWPPEQAVTAAAWHPTLTLAPLCATGTAIGLGRIDWAERGQTASS